MSGILPFIVSGVVTGAVYGLAGTGLLLTYKTSGIFNFAHGAIAAAAAYVFYWLHVDHGIDWKVSFVISVVGLGIVLGAALEVVGRHLAVQRVSYRIVGTIGMILIVQSLATIKYGPDPLRLDQYLPGGNDTFKVGGVVIGWDEVVVTVIALVAVALLYALFRLTRVGVAMRAVVDDPDLVSLHGTSPRRVRRLAWIIGSTFAAASGVLVAPFVGVESVTLTFLVVAAIGAVAIGGFSSIPMTYVGGILIGVVADVSKKYVLGTPWLAGLPSSLPFIALFVVLLAIPKRKLVSVAIIERRSSLEWNAPVTVRVGAGVIILIALALVPSLVGSNLSYYTLGLVTAVMLLSLGLLVRTSNQVSLAHAAFGGIGAVGFSHFATGAGLPWGFAVVLGASLVVPVAAVVAIPAIRLSGLFLALATLAFALMVERLLYPRGFMFGRAGTGKRMPRPSFAQGDDERWYFVVLFWFVLSAIAMVLVNRSRLGRMLRAMSDSSTAASTLGLSTNVTRVIVFCISGFFAGISGILYGATLNFGSFGDRYYTSFNSLIVLAMLAIAPFGVPWYALFALIGGVIPAYITGTHTGDWLNFGFGVFAVLVAVQGGPHHAPQRVRDLVERLGIRRVDHPATVVPVVTAHADEERRTVAATRGAAGLEVRGLVVKFGGLTAVNGVSVGVPMGRITGLIGPNGAGKTTLFNSCSGLNRPTGGQVLLHGDDVSSLGSAARARRGLGRTFQITQLCDSLSVADNVSLGREAGMAGLMPWSQMVAPRAQRRTAAAATHEALEMCGIGQLAQHQAGSLSTGQRRLVELARALSGTFDVLLLDEPSSGLDHDETAQFGQILTEVVRARGCGILLVEHDMALVMNVCAYIYVLDFGRPLYDGTPDQVASSADVQAAYLGTETADSSGASEASDMEVAPS